MRDAPSSSAAMPTKTLATAYHEAGHAVAAFLRPGARGVCSVSIEPDEFSEGRMHRSQNPKSEPNTTPPTLDLGQIIDEVVVLLAGPSAELRFTGCFDSVGAKNDCERAMSLAKRYAHVLDFEGLMSWLRSEAEKFVNTFSAEIESLATELHDRKKLSAREVKRLLEGSGRSP